jgi:hypothetical protein
MKYKKEKSNSTFTEINFAEGATVIENAKEVIINNYCTVIKDTKE